MAKQTLTLPAGSILLSPPNDFVLEKDKTADWFCQYARWIVGTFYNQPRPPFRSGETIRQGIAQEAMENWSYVFQNQENYDYKYMTTNTDNEALPITWVPGGKIASLVDHMKGVLLGSIENIEVTAKNLSRDVASQRAELLEKLLIKHEIQSIVDEMLPKGVSFEPVNDPDADLSTKEDIEKYVDKWQDKYSIIAEKIGQSQLWEDKLKEKFLQDGTNQIVSGISSTLTEVENGFVTNTVIPDFETIWDNRVNDPWNDKAMLCGYIKHNEPYQEVIRKYSAWLSEDEKAEIRMMAMSNTSDLDKFVNYYNVYFGVGNRFSWWNDVGTSKMTVATATVYFIAPRDYRFRNSTNRYGMDRVMRINEDKEYSLEGATIKGQDLAGDYRGWDVHQATLIGNKYIVNYGYMPNTLRERNRSGRPLLPMRTFCSGMQLNQGKSIVRKLIPLQNELDMYAFKIKEKVANDYGKNYVFNGNKFDGNTSTEIVNDLKTLHVYVSSGSSGEADDPQNGQRMVEQVDMTLDNNIIRYIELRSYIEAEMESIVSISKIALGQQRAVVGKGVQEATIEQNSYGTMTLMWGIVKHFNNILQYNVNLKQMLYQFKDTVEEALVIGDQGSYLLKLLNPREFGTQPLLVFLDIASTLDPQQRAELKTIALSEAQNGRLDTVDYVEHILMAPTLNQAVKGLKYAKNKQMKEIESQQAAQSQAQMQHQADLQAQAAFNEAALIQLKEDNANFREEIKAFIKKFDIMTKNGMEAPPEAPPQPPPSPLQGQMAQASQPQEGPPQQGNPNQM